MGRIIDKSSPSYGKVVRILRKQAGRYLIEFEKDGRSYWFTSDKIEELKN